MHDLPDAQPGDGDSLGNCMQTKLTADSNVSGNANVSTIKTDAVLIKPVGGTLAMLTNVDTLKEEPGPAKEEEPGPAKEEPGAGAALADGFRTLAIIGVAAACGLQVPVSYPPCMLHLCTHLCTLQLLPVLRHSSGRNLAST